MKTGFTFGPQLFGVRGLHLWSSPVLIEHCRLSLVLPSLSPFLKHFPSLDCLAAYLEAISALRRTVPYKGNFLFNQLEESNRHSCSAATAAGGLGILAVSAIPAMYRLNLLSAEPQKDFGRLIALVFCSGFFGVFFVIPLRKYYIVHQKLTFPTPAATVISNTLMSCRNC